MIETDMPFLLVSVYMSMCVLVGDKLPNPVLTIDEDAALAGVATTPSPSTTSTTDNLRIALLPWVRAECERSHGDLSSAGRAAARPHDQLRGDLDVRRAAVRGLHRVEQQSQAAAAHLVEILTHGRQRGGEVRGLGDVVAADHAHLVRH